MPAQYLAPGVYVEETSGPRQPIERVATASTVIIGWAAKGPTDCTRQVTGFADFERVFGGLDQRSVLGYSVKLFFENGGKNAHVMRLVANDAKTAAVVLDGGLQVTASSPGAWANDYTAELRASGRDPSRVRFIVRRRLPDGREEPVEDFDDLSLLPGDSRSGDAVINAESGIVRVEIGGGAMAALAPDGARRQLAGGLDGEVLLPNTSAFARHFPTDHAGGVFRQLDALVQFNILFVPGETAPAVIEPLQAYCRKRHAFHIVDSPEDATPEDMLKGPDPSITGPDAMNSALYFPWLIVLDSRQAGSTRRAPPSGCVAGIYARTDDARGVWKAPAGNEADVRGALGVATIVTEVDCETINVRGINCIRAFPTGIVVWGARTLHGDNRLASEWKYVNVRRLSLFIEESIERGLRWVVFEPNDDRLWERVRRLVESFMVERWRAGAFVGSTAREAFFVRCDASTTTQDDIASGRVNCIVGFAPLQPGEFVITRISQVAGQG